jgi:hypothetical protein
MLSQWPWRDARKRAYGDMGSAEWKAAGREPGGSHASAVVSGGWEYDRRASEMR